MTGNTAVRNTVLYNMTFIILGVAVPVVLALLLNEIKNKGINMQCVFYL